MAESAPGGEASSRGLRDLVVLSDLHLGRGLDPATKRYRRLETFFYDDDLRAFCRWLCRDAAERGARFALVLNGDVVDLLRIEPEPAPEAGRVERRFGPHLTPPLAAHIVAEILAGHRGFVEALADVLEAGHDVIFVPGNHDLELQWESPQREVRRALGARLEARGASAEALSHLRFEPWFVYEPGRVWIEHGCQYDPESAFRFPLRRGLADSPGAAVVAERDMPLGNFFQKYLYNAFGPITFIVPSSRANYRYFRFLLANQPRLLLRVALSHGPFLLQLLRRLARAPAAAWHRQAEQAHAAELDDLAARSGLGGRLRAVDALKYVGADAASAASGMLRQGAKVAAAAVLVTVLVMAVWASVWQAVDRLMVGFGWKALLSLVVYLVFAALAAFALVAAALRMPRDEPDRPLRAAAERIASILDVPIVAFGHTHEELVSALPRSSAGAGWYFNTGTWIAVFTHDVLLPRERVQYTFLRIRGHEGELLRWSPGRGRPVPVVLLEDERVGGDHGAASDAAEGDASARG